MSLAQLHGVPPGAPNEFDTIQPPGGDPDAVGPYIAYSGPKLPTQPQALLRAIDREMRETRAPPTPANMFNVISQGLLFDATSPALRAALYRVIAQLPGVQVLGRRTDAIGREGIASRSRTSRSATTSRRSRYSIRARVKSLKARRFKPPRSITLMSSFLLVRRSITRCSSREGSSTRSRTCPAAVRFQAPTHRVSPMRRTAADAAEFSALYQETNADLLAFLLRRCPTAEDAADCLAEAYLVAWNKRDQIPPDSEIRPWLFGVARNVMLRGHQQRTRITAATTALAQELHSARALHPGPLEEQSNRLREALTELSAVDREIIMMIAWDQLKPGEIGTILGLSANVVRVRVHRARARLRSLLASSELEEAEQTRLQ
jgi:RNA polymerase sigma-70 factor (ECF subfamily)